MFCQQEGVGLSGELTAGIGGGWKKEQWHSHHERAIKGEVEIRASAGANASLYAQPYKFKESDSQGNNQVGGNISPDLLNALFFKWENVSEGKLEHAAVVLSA